MERNRRRNPQPLPDTIIPPFPWSGNLRAKVRSLAYLRAEGITVITGQVQCKRCNGVYTMEFDLEQKFREVSTYFAAQIGEMKDRAPEIWLKPALPACRLCEQPASVRPVIPADNYELINWLFLFLGQMLGCCTLHQLKYFLQHANLHRTGAKDRLVFSTYLELCSQLQPEGPHNLF